MIVAVLFSLVALIGFPALILGATEVPQIYRCEYRATKPDGRVFTMSGNIILSDVDTSSPSNTYLTLEPPKVSGIDITARVLITYWTDNGGYYYNPMTLHPRGNTAAPIASALLSGNEQELAYVDSEKKTSYRLNCKQRP